MEIGQSFLESRRFVVYFFYVRNDQRVATSKHLTVGASHIYTVVNELSQPALCAMHTRVCSCSQSSLPA